jgi:PAS domain S-box-containing protein
MQTAIESLGTIDKPSPWYASRSRILTASLLVALGYYLGARIGFALTFQAHAVSTLWPPNSILLAGLLLTPRRSWWFLLAAALPAHLIIELNTGVPIPMVLCWYVSNCFEALIGATFICYLTNGPIRFDTSRGIAIFLCGAVLAPFISSFLDAGFVVLNAWGTGGYWQVWRMRFLANVLAELTVVPFIVLWFTDGIRFFRKLSPYRFLEGAGLVLGLLIVGIFVLSGQGSANLTPALLYTPLPFLLWAAIRFGPKGISTSLVAVTFLAIWGAINGGGPFTNRSPEENAFSVQLFLILISLPLITLGAVIQEQKRLRETAGKNEEQLKLALNAARMGTWDWHIQDNETKWSDETKRMFGFLPTDSEVPPEVFYEMIHEDDRDAIKDAIDRSIREGGPYAAEFRILKGDGSISWVSGRGKVLVDDDGTPVRMVGVNADITKRKQAEEQLMQRSRQIRALAGRLMSAQEDERRRLSRELHDDLSQEIAALSVAISNLKRKRPATTEQIVAELDQLHQQTNELTDHIRQLSHELHPPALEHVGLKLALETYASQFQRQEGIDIEFAAHLKSERLPFDISVCLYRIALEGLRNIVKHSNAKNASILLEENNHSLTLEIADKGVGFDLREARSGSGLGLVSAEERIRLLQGNFEIRTAPNKGTTLTATIPLLR